VLAGRPERRTAAALAVPGGWGGGATLGEVSLLCVVQGRMRNEARVKRGLEAGVELEKWPNGLLG
jgi:hypothetical protein